MASVSTNFDYVIIGGGFYGCCFALYLRSISKRVLLIENSDKLMNRASRVNQARIHTGFHYPRSAVTAVKSMLLHRQFVQDFSDAVVDDFQMLYAIPYKRSKVSAKRFYRMFRDIGAPIQPATPNQSSLFNPDMVEEVFACYEAAFDYSVLERQLTSRLDKAGVDIRLSTEVTTLSDNIDGVILDLSDGSEVTARYAFNITYSQINTVLTKADLPRANLKHELAELALITPPPELAKIGVTVMDGPFFSCMPYPSTKLHSLTHVRYTPHDSWVDDGNLSEPYDIKNSKLETRYAHMIRDGQRYLPCLRESHYKQSIFEVKTLLIKNEQDDGRPILFQQAPSSSNVISILGGKIDNIYDLFELVKKTSNEFAAAHDGILLGKTD